MEDDKKKTEEVENSMQIRCESCGGVMRYSPLRQNLKCIYCGFEKELDKTPIEVEAFSYDEHSAHAGEEKEADAKGMHEIKEIRCQQCGAVTSLPENVSSMKCPFCGTSLVLGNHHVKRTWKPGAMLPFKVEEKKGKIAYKTWLSGKWFAPSKLTKNVADPSAFKGVYLPYWAYDARTHTLYTGARGTDYTRTVRRNGKDERVTETEWRNVSGLVNEDFNNLLVAATNTLPSSISNVLTNWDLENSVAYREEFVSGFITELYKKDFVDCMPQAQEKMRRIIEDSIRNDIGGDHQRIKSQQTTYEEVMFKLFLLPLWISSFTYNGKAYQFVVNGRTGEVTGDYPISALKVTLAVVAAIILAVLIYNWMQ